MRKLVEDSGNAGTEDPAVPTPVSPAAVISVTGHPMLGNCECGSDTFVLVNEFRETQAPGFRSSRMYECVKCAKYRLAK